MKKKILNINKEINKKSNEKNIDETDKMSIIDLKIKEIKEIQKNLIVEEDKVINLKRYYQKK